MVKIQEISKIMLEAKARGCRYNMIAKKSASKRVSFLKVVQVNGCYVQDLPIRFQKSFEIVRIV